jgi:hypothetical protein
METATVIVVVVLAFALLVTAVLLLRSPSAHPWPAIVAAMLTSGVCYTIGGVSVEDTPGPNAATVAASVVGLLSVVAAVIALIPRSRSVPASRAPIVLSSAGIVLGSVGLVLTVVTG